VRIYVWPIFLLVLSAIVVRFGEPRPVALIVGGVGVLTAVVDYLRELDR
jgi:hypothetical protein